MAPGERTGADRVAREVLASGLGAAITDSIFNPLDIIKVRMQLQQPGNAAGGAGSELYYKSMVHGLKRVSREEGMLWLWRPGLEATWLRAFSSTGLRIGLYNTVKNNIQALMSPSHDTSQPISLPVKVLSGGLTGALGSAISNPIDVVRTRLQVEMAPLNSQRTYVAGLHKGLPPRYTGTLNAFVSVAKEEGVRSGLYKGTSATIFRAVCLSGTQLATYDQLKILLRGGMDEGVLLHSIAAMSSAVAAQTVAMPADTLKSRVLNDVRADASLRKVLRETLRLEGPRALFRGYVAAVSRQAPVIVVQMPIVEHIRLMLGVGYL